MAVKTSKVKAPLGMQTLTYYPIKTEPDSAHPTYDTGVDLGAAVKGYLTVTTASASIPGDDIMGYIDNKNRIEIHRRDCDVASRLKASFGNRILDARWDMHKVMFFDATIELRGIDRKGMLHDISEVISDKLDVNMHRITISSEEGIFDGTIEIRVHDRSEVSVIMDELKKIEDLKEVLQIL